jgi:hypothetical protein
MYKQAPDLLSTNIINKYNDIQPKTYSDLGGVNNVVIFLHRKR